MKSSGSNSPVKQMQMVQEKEKSDLDNKASTSKSISSLSAVRDSNIRLKDGKIQTGLYNVSKTISQFLTNAPNSDFKSASAYVCTAQPDRLSQLFNISLTKEKEARVLRLLKHIVRGEQKEAEAMLKNNLSLLLEKGRVTDYSGRVIEGTALQLALGAEDIGIHEGEECMVEMIQRHLIRLPIGETAIIEQIKQQFPEGYEKEEIKKQEADLNAVNALIKAIGDSKATNTATLEKECEAALNQFRNYLKPSGVITTGQHSNVRMLVKAFEFYYQKYAEFGNDKESPKNKLFWEKGIGGIQRSLPANYAQAFCQSLYNYVICDKKLDRRLKVTVFSIDSDPFFPLDSNPRYRLGYDYAHGSPRIGGGDAFYLQMCVEQKQLRCKRLVDAAKIRDIISTCNHIQTINREIISLRNQIQSIKERMCRM